MSNNVASLGETVDLRCSSYGYPNPLCRIYRKSALVNVNGSVLVIRNFTAADQGEYMCNCSNAVGAEVVNITLFLYGELWCHYPVIDKGGEQKTKWHTQTNMKT